MRSPSVERDETQKVVLARAPSRLGRDRDANEPVGG